MIRGACFDIDGTLATHQLGYHPVGYFEIILAGLLCRKQKKPVEALELVCRTEEELPGSEPCPAARQLGISEEEYREELTVYQRKYLTPHEDTLCLLDFLTLKKLPVFITTNNTEGRARIVLEFLGCISKVSRIYTPQRTGFRKNSPDFWRFVIADTGVPGKDLVVVGDEPRSDSDVPLQGGIGRTFLLPPFPGRAKLPSDWLIRKMDDCIV